jgi:hypothetical protein
MLQCTKSACNRSPVPYNSFHAALQQKDVVQGGTTSNPFHHCLGEPLMLTPEQLVASQKANLETIYGLTTKAFEGVEKLVELNLQATKAALAESNSHAPGAAVGQGRARAAGPASRRAAAPGREGRRLQPPPV